MQACASLDTASADKTAAQAKPRYGLLLSQAILNRYSLAAHSPKDPHQGLVKRIHKALGRWAGARHRVDVPLDKALEISAAYLAEDNRPLNLRALSHRTLARQPLAYLERIGVATLRPGSIQLHGLTWRNGHGHIIDETHLPGRAETARFMARERKARERQKGAWQPSCYRHVVESPDRGILAQRIGNPLGDALKPPLRADFEGAFTPVTPYNKCDWPKSAAGGTSFSDPRLRGQSVSGVDAVHRHRRQTSRDAQLPEPQRKPDAPSDAGFAFLQAPSVLDQFRGRPLKHYVPLGERSDDETTAKVLGKHTFASPDPRTQALPRPPQPSQPAVRQTDQQASQTLPAPQAPKPVAPTSPSGRAAQPDTEVSGHVCDPNTRPPKYPVPKELEGLARLHWLDANPKAVAVYERELAAYEKAQGIVKAAVEPEPLQPEDIGSLALMCFNGNFADMADEPPPEPKTPIVSTPRHGERPTVPVAQQTPATEKDVAELSRQYPELMGLKPQVVLRLRASRNQLHAAALNARAHKGPASNPCGLFFHALRRIHSQSWGVRVEVLR